MTWKPPHPLLVWLSSRKKVTSLHAFSQEKGIPFRSLYRHTEGASRNPSMQVMESIAAATRNKISVRAQVEWLKKRRKIEDAS